MVQPRHVGPAKLTWQPQLLADAVNLDVSFSSCMRIRLDESSWVDHAPGWLSGNDAVFAELAETADWTARTVVMYGAELPEPRLTARWQTDLEPEVLGHIRSELSQRYGVRFDSVGVNLYRDGNDSVAWHRDRVHRKMIEPLVATITLGHPRRFALRPRGGGTTVSLTPHAGDLVVMGGRCQQDWEHAVPKCRHARPRMAITVRHTHQAVHFAPAELTPAREVLVQER